MPDIQEDIIKISHDYFMVSRSNNAILVDEPTYSKLCAFCGSDLDMEEGVMIYDKNWYHNTCWDSFESPKEVIRND